MAEDLQDLLKRINDEGVEKAEAEKDRILSEARENARQIVAKARKEAEGIVARASEEAALEKKRAGESVRQASRDVILALEGELQKRLRRLCRAAVGESMTADTMGRIVLEMSKKFAAGGKDAQGLQVLLGQKDLDAAGDKLMASLKKSLGKEPELMKSPNISAGLKVGAKGGDLFFDFSDDALSEILCSYLGPRLASILNTTE